MGVFRKFGEFRSKFKGGGTREALIEAVMGRASKDWDYDTFLGIHEIFYQIKYLLQESPSLGKADSPVWFASILCDWAARWAEGRKSLACPDKITPVGLSAYGPLPDVVNAFLSNSCKLQSLVVLLHGVPGTGKSYFATLFGGYTISFLSQFDPKRGMQKEEDEDEIRSIAFAGGGMYIVNEIDRLTPGGVNNLQADLDAIRVGSRKTLVVLTTNHFDVLKDLPLVRPGRVDICYEVGEISDEDAVAVCKGYEVEWEKESFNGRMTVAAVAQYARDKMLQALIKESRLQEVSSGLDE